MDAQGVKSLLDETMDQGLENDKMNFFERHENLANLLQFRYKKENEELL